MENEESFRYANLVKDLINSNSYKLTIGVWLEEMKKAATQTLLYLEMGDDRIWQCQAELKVIDLIYSKIQAQIDKAEYLRLKNLKKDKADDNRSHH